MGEGGGVKLGGGNNNVIDGYERPLMELGGGFLYIYIIDNNWAARPLSHPLYQPLQTYIYCGFLYRMFGCKKRGKDGNIVISLETHINVHLWEKRRGTFSNTLLIN